MHIRAATLEPADALRGHGVVHTRGGIDDQAWAIEREPHELALRCGQPASSAGAHGYMGNQDDTSESQLIARWRSRARSPMSIPVVVAIASIGVLMRSSGE
jgi:hypothetical protein